MILLPKPSEYFVSVVEPLKAREATKAYVVGVFLEALKNKEKYDLQSIVLSYSEAVSLGKFENFQTLGDWLLWSLSFVPEYHSGFENLALDFGRKSYETCWLLLRKKWDVYAELADSLPTIVDGVRRNIR